MAYRDYQSNYGRVNTESFGYKDLFGIIGRGTEAQAGEVQKAAESLFRTRAEGIRGSYEQYSSEMEADLQARGVDPTFARRKIAEVGAGVPMQIASARGEAEMLKAQGLQQVIAGDVQSRVSLGVTVKQQNFMEYLQKRAERQARRDRAMSMYASIASLALAGVGMYGLAAGAAGGGLGGGGTTSPFNASTWQQNLSQRQWPNYS